MQVAYEIDRSTSPTSRGDPRVSAALRAKEHLLRAHGYQGLVALSIKKWMGCRWDVCYLHCAANCIAGYGWDVGGELHSYARIDGVLTCLGEVHAKPLPPVAVIPVLSRAVLTRRTMGSVPSCHDGSCHQVQVLCCGPVLWHACRSEHAKRVYLAMGLNQKLADPAHSHDPGAAHGSCCGGDGHHHH